MTCIGLCCHGFRIPYTKSELLRALWAERTAKRTGKYPGWVREDGSVSFDRVMEIEKLATMVYELPVGTVDMGPQDGLRPLSTKERPVFSCIHWDRVTHLCRDYENRPKMCRDYPYSAACEVPGCEFKFPEVRPLGVAMPGDSPQDDARFRSIEDALAKIDGDAFAVVEGMP